MAPNLGARADHGDARAIARDDGDDTRALELLRESAKLGGWQRHRDACAARIEQLTNDDFDRGLTAGRDLELDEAVQEALGAP